MSQMMLLQPLMCYKLQQIYSDFTIDHAKKSNQDGVIQQIEIIVYDYLKKVLGIALTYSADLPSICVGKSRSPWYFQIEVIKLYCFYLPILWKLFEPCSIMLSS
ncbi:hypothetical protein ACH5RR_021819 [Cinchona calisaya]|uniref:Uncharacterized protein n=1 Tax=Cinchona calisaya TaxID=153742 RepID=A0ABD2ZID4_9GENT